MDQIEKLLDTAKKENITITEDQAKLLVKYYEMLVETNKVMNLTAITEFDEVLTKHFIDSLSIVRVHDFNKPLTLIDVGTGAGFPGIPLKIIFPKIKVTLMDSLNKRINFLREVISELKLEDICAVHARAEDLGRDSDYREKYDICVSRAVANLSTLSEYCMPLVKVKGFFISYKGSNVLEEVKNAKKAVKLLGGRINGCEEFNLDGDIGRSFVIIEKVDKISDKYPRSSGKPSKEPL